MWLHMQFNHEQFIFRHYFALPTNPGEQFYYFTSIAAWLLQMCGKHFEMPQEYDDPNATISSILDETRSLVSLCRSIVLKSLTCNMVPVFWIL